MRKQRRRKRCIVPIFIIIGGLSVFAVLGMRYRERMFYGVGPVITDSKAVRIGSIEISGPATEEMKSAAEYLSRNGYAGKLVMLESDKQDTLPNGILENQIPYYYELYADNGDTFECVKSDGGFLVWGCNDPFPDQISPALKNDADTMDGNVAVQAKVPDGFTGGILLTFTDNSGKNTRLYLSASQNYVGSSGLTGGEEYQYTGKISGQADKYELYSGSFTVNKEGKTVVTVYVIEKDY